jgi:SAM-dependent methyltransferase
MGYTERTFPDVVARWFDAGWLEPGHRLIDFGAQEFYSSSGPTRDALQAFLQGRGTPDGAIEAALGPSGVPEVGAIYRLLGVDYVAIDVDRAHGAAYFDLNTFAPPAAWLGTFDFVNNEGTIEHLINPINGFQVAHELARPGAVIRHSMPLSGNQHHGFMYPTLKFFHRLIQANDYELLDGCVSQTAAQDEVLPKGFRAAGDLPSYGRWLHLAYRKTLTRDFVVPYDHLQTPAVHMIARDLRRQFREYSARRLGVDTTPANPRKKPAAYALSALLFEAREIAIWLRLRAKRFLS